MELAEYKRLYGEVGDTPPGWSAIDQRLEEIYGEQEPKHWGSVPKWATGGQDPIDGMSAYLCHDGGRDHLHFVTYFSELYYNEASVGGEFSNFGFELTFRLAADLPPSEYPMWVWGILQYLARYIFKTGQWFEENHWITVHGPLRAEPESALRGFVFVKDPILGAIDTPHGRVEFIQCFGITGAELDAIMADGAVCLETIRKHQEINPLMITDIDRE